MLSIQTGLNHLSLDSLPGVVIDCSYRFITLLIPLKYYRVSVGHLHIFGTYFMSISLSIFTLAVWNFYFLKNKTFVYRRIFRLLTLASPSLKWQMYIFQLYEKQIFRCEIKCMEEIWIYCWISIVQGLGY